MLCWPPSNPIIMNCQLRIHATAMNEHTGYGRPYMCSGRSFSWSHWLWFCGLFMWHFLFMRSFSVPVKCSCSCSLSVYLLTVLVQSFFEYLYLFYCLIRSVLSYSKSPNDGFLYQTFLFPNTSSLYRQHNLHFSSL